MMMYVAVRENKAPDGTCNSFSAKGGSLRTRGTWREGGMRPVCAALSSTLSFPLLVLVVAPVVPAPPSPPTLASHDSRSAALRPRHAPSAGPLSFFLQPMATAVYSAQQPINTYLADPAQQPSEEQYISTFFCRALYDYQTRDASSLSFHKNDIIEVLTQLESGWWDGLLGDERGWFPSNYVVVISEQEAEAALSATGDFSQTSSLPAAAPDDSMLDMSRALSGSSTDANWLESEASFSTSQHAMQQAALPEKGRQGHHNDFWVPQVSQDGRVSHHLSSSIFPRMISCRTVADILRKHTDRTAIPGHPSGDGGR